MSAPAAQPRTRITDRSWLPGPHCPPSQRQLVLALAWSLRHVGIHPVGASDPLPDGGVVLEPAADGHGVHIRWVAHHRLYTNPRTSHRVLPVLDCMDAALDQLLAALGWQHRPRDGARPTLVTGHPALGRPSFGGSPAGGAPQHPAWP